MGPMVLKALRDYGITAPIGVRLMVKPVDSLIPQFAEAGASYITFHPEASMASARPGRLADQRAWLQSGAGVESGDAAELPRLRDGQAGYHS